MTDKDQQALDSLIARGIRIPPQPQILVELREAISGGDYTMTSIGNVINKDPGLVAALFKISRSPAFTRDRKFSRLAEVLQIIGIQQTCNLVQAITLANTISDSKRKAFARFWGRCGEVAALASLIATDRITVCNVFPDQAYLAGIFLKCGVPVLMLRFRDYCRKLNLDDAASWPDLAEEDAHYKVDHCTIGYLVARHWGLPDFVCAAIRYQAEIPPEQTGAAVSLVSIAQLANHAYLFDHGLPDPQWPTIGRRVIEELGITTEEFDDYLERLLNRYHGASL